MDFQKIRKEYENEGLRESELPDQPLTGLKQWLEIATEHSPGRWFETNAMSLATSDQTGNVTVRTVLLKGITDEGIRFFTNYGSEKARQLDSNPRAAVVIHWPYLGRQVRLRGTVEKTSREVSEEYFHSRPRGSQIGALASRQSTELESRSMLDQIAQEIAARYADSEIPLPDDWGGYLIRAEQVEFWQGRLDRLHDRIVFRLVNGNWNRFRLAP